MEGYQKLPSMKSKKSSFDLGGFSRFKKIEFKYHYLNLELQVLYNMKGLYIYVTFENTVLFLEGWKNTNILFWQYWPNFKQFELE